jgi:hypothetical protein
LSTWKCCNNLDSEGFKSALKNSSKLRYIELYSLPSVTGYTQIFGECSLKHLQTFRARECPDFNKGDEDFLRKNCPRIAEISVTEIFP